MKLASLVALPFCLTTLLTLESGCSHAAGVAKTATPTIITVAERAGDRYVTPQGAGTKDGSSWANALDGAGLQQGWDALKPGQTLWVGSGEYSNGRLSISSGGEAGKLKTLAGKDTGGGLPIFTSNFNKSNPAKSGIIFVNAGEGADYWAVQNIQLRNYAIGIASKAGGHEGVRIQNFDVTGCREGISLNGGGTAQNPDSASHNWIIRDCEFINYTKRGIRLRNGNYDFQIMNCVADAGGREWATEPFQMGFSVEGAYSSDKTITGTPDHDISYTNCVALNNYHNNGTKYWNADGYSAERGVSNLSYLNCMAFDNTDGGWDLKAEEVSFENCISMGNKRNFRLWGLTNTLTNCLIASSVWPGGSGGHTGLWTSGAVTVDRSTFYDSGIGLDKAGKVTVSNSIVVRSKERSSATPLGSNPGVTFINTLFWDEGTSQGTNPQLTVPVALWDGRTTGFNASQADKGQGFVFPAGLTPPAGWHRTKPLVPGTKAESSPESDTPAVASPPKTPEQLAAEAKLIPTLKNGGFEEDLAGWSKAKEPMFTVKSEGAAEGNKFLNVSSQGRAEAQINIGNLVAGEKYTLSFQSRNNTSTDARLILRDGAAGKYLKFATPSTGTDWTTRTVTFNAPASEVLLQIGLRAAGSFDLDNVTIKRGS